MPKKIDPELKAQAVRLVQEHRQDYPSVTAASLAVARQLGLGRETVRRWVVQAEVDDGARPGTTTKEIGGDQTVEGGEPPAPRKMSRSSGRRRLSSRENSTPAAADHGVHRLHAQPRDTRSSRPAGCSPSTAARSPRGPTGPGTAGSTGRRPHRDRRGRGRCPAGHRRTPRKSCTAAGR